MSTEHGLQMSDGGLEREAVARKGLSGRTIRLAEHGEQQVVGSEKLFAPSSALRRCQINDSSLTRRQLQSDLSRSRPSGRPQLCLELATNRTQIDAAVLQGCNRWVLRLTEQPERDVAWGEVVVSASRSNAASNC